MMPNENWKEKWKTKGGTIVTISLEEFNKIKVFNLKKMKVARLPYGYASPFMWQKGSTCNWIDFPSARAINLFDKSNARGIPYNCT